MRRGAYTNADAIDGSGAKRRRRRHSGPHAFEAAGESCADPIDQFKAEIRGGPKYVLEATRQLSLLAESIGNLKPAAVTVAHLDKHLAQFGSPWSHDDALKFARAFFKWLCSPRVRARGDNPTDTFEFKRPSGSKVYLSLPDVEHVMRTCREHLPEIVGPIAPQLFAGIRTEEIIRANWSMIRRGMVRLQPEVAKMGQVKGKKVRRIIDFWPKALDCGYRILCQEAVHWSKIRRGRPVRRGCITGFAR